MGTLQPGSLPTLFSIFYVSQPEKDCDALFESDFQPGSSTLVGTGATNKDSSFESENRTYTHVHCDMSSRVMVSQNVAKKAPRDWFAKQKREKKKKKQMRNGYR